MKHKTKIFKEVFQANAETIHPNQLVSKIQVMEEHTFVPIMGEMFSKARDKYSKRTKKEAINFAKFMVDTVNSKTFSDGIWDEIYDKWKKLTH